MRKLLSVLLILLSASAAQPQVISDDGIFAPANTNTYTAQGISFDGSTYINLASNYSGAVDGQQGTFSAWIWFKGGDATTQLIQFHGQAATTRMSVSKNTSNQIAIFARTSAPATALNFVSSTTYTTAMTGYVWVAASWDTSTGTCKIWVNGTDVTGTVSTCTGVIDYNQTSANEAIGAAADGSSKGTFWIADVYVNWSTAIDFSNPANVAKFSIGGHPADLGTNCATPTGSQPIVCLKGALATWNTNQGSGTGFSVAAGALAAAGSNP